GGNNYYFEREEGWGVSRSEGDAFTPTPTPGTLSCSYPIAGSLCNASPADVHLISVNNGTDTNTTGLPQQGGYNYLIYVPAGDNVNVQVYNPLFAPDYDACKEVVSCSSYSYHEYDSSFTPGSTDKTQYSSVSYTIYDVATVFQHTNETVLSQEIFYPIDATPEGQGNAWYYR